MTSQMACLSGWIIALVTLVRLLSTVHPHVVFQMACSRSWIGALITLEGLLSTVRSHVAFQMTCLRGWIDALITLVWLLTTVCFKTPYLSWRECAHWLHLFSFSPVCVLICLLRWLAVDDEKEHWLHLWDSIRVFANSWSSSIIICFLFDPLILYCLTQTEERWKASKKRKWKFWKSLVFLSPVSVSAWNSFRELLLLLD